MLFVRHEWIDPLLARCQRLPAAQEANVLLGGIHDAYRLVSLPLLAPRLHRASAREHLVKQRDVACRQCSSPRVLQQAQSLVLLALANERIHATRKLSLAIH